MICFLKISFYIFQTLNPQINLYITILKIEYSKLNNRSWLYSVLKKLTKLSIFDLVNNNENQCITTVTMGKVSYVIFHTYFDPYIITSPSLHMEWW